MKNLEFKGTKGEWKITSNSANIVSENALGLLASAWSVYDREGVEIRNEGESWLSMRRRTDKIREDKELERKANAKLIAAAPDLLEACKIVFNICDKLQMPTETEVEAMKNDCRIAIEKALGK